MYSLATSLLKPLALGLLCSLVAAGLLWRRRRGRRRRLAILTVILLLLAASCTDLVGNAAIGTLERSYPAGTPLPDKADAIVVLAGGLRVLNGEGTLVELDPGTMARCAKAAEVYHHVGRCPVICSGGPRRIGDNCPSNADKMRDFLILMGVDANDVRVEGNSRTTFENAVLSCELLGDAKGDRIVLVSEASHLTRAKACFEAAGCPVIPVGCDYESQAFTWRLSRFLPSATGALKMQRATHEWIGLLWYWLRGRLS